MEKNSKRKITVEIAGMPLTLVTDEADSFVDTVVGQVNERMQQILAGGVRTGTSNLGAALLCAIDAAGERLKAEKRIRNLEAQLSLCEVNIRNLREELENCRGNEEAPVKSDDGFERLSQMLRAGDENGTAEDKVRTLERYLENKKDNQGGMSREEKIRYIESLLRGNED